MKSSNKEIIKNISKKLDLPSWWVQSVIIEYFPCRQFLVGEKFFVYDFNLITAEMIDMIRSKKVVIPDYMLLQNITPTDFSYRLPQLMTGQSKLPFKYVKNIIPEVITNNTVFAFGQDSEEITEHDVK